MSPKQITWLKTIGLLIVLTLALATLITPPDVTAQTGGQIGYGTTVYGAVDTATPLGIYSFTGTTGDVIRLDVIPLAGNFQPAITLNDPAGQPLATNQGDRLSAHHQNAALVDQVLPQDGTYILLVSGANGTTGNFALRLQGRAAVPETVLPFNTAVDVTLQPAVPAQHFTFMAEDCPTALLVTQQTTVPYVVKVRTAQGRLVAQVRGTGNVFADRVTVAPLSGRYTVEVIPDDPTATGIIRLLVTCAGDAGPDCPPTEPVPASDPGVPVCPACPTCPPDRTTIPDCPLMDLTAILADDGSLTITWNPVLNIDHYLLHMYGLVDGVEHYLGAAGAPPTATEFFLPHLFPGFDGYRFVIEAIQDEAVICSDETTITVEDRTLDVCPPLDLTGRVTDPVERWIQWAWTGYPEANGYYGEVVALMPDGSTWPYPPATLDPPTITWNTHHAAGDVASDTFRLQLWLLVDDERICPEEATVTFPPTQRVGDMPCEISTEWEGIAVHVGPGRLRTVFRTLIPGQVYPVIGYAYDDTGHLWWQLDKTFFDGHEAVISLWVKESDVSEHGNCDDVPQGQVPGIVPIEPEVDITEVPPGPGTWLGCGSCDSCGHPAEECVTDPAGQCLWDPNTCVQQPEPPPDGGGDNQQPPPDDTRGGNEPPPQPNCVTVNAIAEPSNAGTAGPTTSGNCISEIRGIYNPGTSVQVQAFPNSGCWLQSWSGCGAGGDTNPVTITVNSSCTITAHLQCLQ